MGKKKAIGYNDFLDGEKLTGNREIRTSLQDPSSSRRQEISPPPATRSLQNNTRRSESMIMKRPQLTHFLCLPLTSPQTCSQLSFGLEDLKTHLGEFTTIPVTAVRPVGTLHLTLGVMSLDSSTLDAAINHVQNTNLHALLRDMSLASLAEEAAADGLVCENLNAAGLDLPPSDHLSVDLKGLVAMHAPSKTSILYAKPEDQSARIYPFAKHLKAGLETAGLMLKEDRDLKLHATMINMIYAKDGDHRRRGQGHGANTKRDTRFDARDLIERYEGFVWAEGVRIDRVQICKMGAKKVWSGGQKGEGSMVDEMYEVVFEKMFGE